MSSCVRLSQGGVLPRRLNLGSRYNTQTTSYNSPGETQMGSPATVVPNRGWVG